MPWPFRKNEIDRTDVNPGFEEHGPIYAVFFESTLSGVVLKGNHGETTRISHWFGGTPV